MIEWVKSHPIITVGALLAGVAAIILVNSGGDTGAIVSSADPTGSSLAMQQQQLQSQNNALNASLQAKESDNATGLAIAELQAKYGYDVATLSAGVATAKINADAQTGALQSTLLAQTQLKSIQADVDKTALSTSAAVATTALYADTVKTQAAYNAHTAQSAIAAASANSCHGFSCLF